MSNPFDDLEVDEADESESDDESSMGGLEDDGLESASMSTAEAGASTPERSPSTADDAGTDQSSDRDGPGEEPASDDSDEDQPSPSETGPAFEYSEVRQRPLYARDETWNKLEDELGITVTPELRRMGIRDEETREIHDALLKVAIEHIEEVPETVADLRRSP